MESVFRLTDQFSKLKTNRIEKPAFLVTCQAEDSIGLLSCLDLLEANVNNGAGISELALQSAADFSTVQYPFTLSLVGKEPTELQLEINHARRGLPRAITQNSEWQTPAGSYFTTQPVGPDAAIAFVYPGAFSSYPGMGRDLFVRYPEAANSLRALTTDPWHAIRGDQIYPEGLEGKNPAEYSALEAELTADPVAMLSSGTTLAIALTWVLKEKFQLRPHTAFGYSLGESSMLFALGVWHAGDDSMRALEESPVFYSRLAGRREAVSEYWNEQSLSSAAAWQNYLLMVSPQEASQAVNRRERVYMTHINAPRQVVIGGDPKNCEEVIAEVGCQSLKAPFDHVLHCPPVRSEYDELYKFSDWPVTPANHIALLSADEYSALPADRKQIASSIARMLCHPLDFPRLIEEAYTQGARVFIEVGAGSNCTRWVDESLGSRAHLAVASNRRGLTDQHMLTRLMARLASHRVRANYLALNG